ncbi:MAG: AMP-binding protein [Dermatophilaceae bacterium]
MYTFATPLDRAVRTNPNARAVVCEGRELTYAELAVRCRKLGGALRSLGLNKGDRVGVVGPNSDRYFELYFTVPACGYILVPVNSRLAGPEIADVLEDAGAKVVFMEGDFPVPDCVERIIRVPDEYDALVEGAEEVTLGEDVHEDDLAVLFYTSGTTGLAKGAMHTHRGLLSSGLHFMAVWPFNPDTIWIVASPMFHTGGILAVMSTVWGAGTHVILPSFDPEKALDLIEKEKVTHTLLVPTMLAAAARAQAANPRDVSSLRYLSHGASPISVETLRLAHEQFPNAELVHLYGTTETTPITAVLAREEQLFDTPQIKSCGQPAIGMELRIVDPATGEERAPNDIGELYVRGASVMQGYWGKADDSSSAIINGWYKTGDLGYLDERSHLYLVDRAKDMIVTGGENVYSVEVENALASHPAVQEVAVFGIPHLRWGEAVHAVVVTSTEVTSDELIEHCRSRIAGFKMPKTLEVRSKQLPKSAAGKILKRDLRDPFWADTGSHVSGS